MWRGRPPRRDRITRSPPLVRLRHHCAMQSTTEAASLELSNHLCIGGSRVERSSPPGRPYEWEAQDPKPWASSFATAVKGADRIRFKLARAEQAWQLGDVARYAPCLILCQHLRYVSRVPCLTRRHVGERLPIGVTHFEPAQYLLNGPWWWEAALGQRNEGPLIPVGPRPSYRRAQSCR